MPFAPRDRRQFGFTLIELLTVMTIVMILVSIAIGGIRGARERTAIGRAKSELALLAQALEDYRRLYGDYPQTGPSAANAQKITLAANGLSTGPGLATIPARLLNALIGVYGPSDFSTRLNGPLLVDVSRLTLEIPFSSSTQTTTNLPTTFAVATGSPPAKTAQNNSFVDPWGNRYLYFYKPASPPGRPATSAWRAPSYVLYSAGPDGLQTPPNTGTGLFTGTTQTTGTGNADNLYADKL